MKTWTFFGRIVPDRIPLKLAPVEMLSIVADSDLRFRSTINIADGQFIERVVIERGDTDIFTLRNLVESNLRLCTDIVGYLEGLSYDVEIISAVSELGEWRIFGISIPALAERRKTQVQAIDGSLLAAIASEPAAHSIILADFREAMRMPLQTGFFCYRAIEGMMQSMKPDYSEGDPAGWDRLRTNLRVERSAIDSIKEYADFPRHGKLRTISDKKRAELFKLTDEIIRRYLAYLMRGKAALPEAEFPPLTV